MGEQVYLTSHQELILSQIKFEGAVIHVKKSKDEENEMYFFVEETGYTERIREQTVNKLRDNGLINRVGNIDEFCEIWA